MVDIPYGGTIPVNQTAFHAPFPGSKGKIEMESVRRATGLSLFIALSLALGLGCAGDGGNQGATVIPPPPGPGGTVDYETQIQPIFDESCSCHLSVSAPGGLTLLSGISYDALVGVNSSQSSSLQLVEPGEPDRSYLVIKIDDILSTLRVGERMPRGSSPLSDSKIQLIRTWIEEGAQRSAATDDTEPPQFGGATSAVAISSTEIDVFWDAAVDNRTASESIWYSIFVATDSVLHDFLQPSLEVTGALTARVDNLEPATHYYFVVRARDEAGNLETNLFEVSATTLDPTPPDDFQRGDTDNDGQLTANDANLIMEFLFRGSNELVCFQVADVNSDRSVNLSDAIFLLKHIFTGTEAPAPLTEEEIRACSGDDSGDIERGLAIYNQPDPSGNGFSCSTCHATTPDEESELLHAGHSLHDALRRPSFNLGEFTEVIDAVNICRVHWMKTTSWESTDSGFVDLVAFLESISPSDPTPALVYEITPPTVSGSAQGDAQMGCALFHHSCVVCHGPGAEGTPLAPSLVNFPLGADFIRAKIRLSGPREAPYEGLLGGQMPFWSKDKLSDDQVEDLAEFLEAIPVPDCSNE